MRPLKAAYFKSHLHELYKDCSNSKSGNPFFVFYIDTIPHISTKVKTIIYILLLVDKYVLPVITSFPAVALNLVSPVRRCLVRHWYVFFPSSLLTFLICSSPDGKTTYFPSYLNREERTLDTCHKLTKYN